MGKRWSVGVLLAAGLLAGTATANAQQDGDLVREVAGLGDSLDRLVVLLERVTEQQRIDLLLRRIELEERRLIPVSSDLRSLEGDYENQKTLVKRYQEMLAQMEDELSEEIRRGVDRPDSEPRQMIPGIERELQIEIGRIEDLERRIRRLEDELAEGRREIAILDEQLRELLDE
jgi:predicted  nucleic acid-binding Zn-ribbon protein